VKPIVLDFETEPIRSRPAHYPPKPVSFSLQLPRERTPKFYAWGHKTGGNNCNLLTARNVLKAAWAEISDETPLVVFNEKFDLDVAETHFGLPLPPWHRRHDVMYLLFLHDPHQRQLGLKPAAERLLNMPRAERDVVDDWVISHQDQLIAEFPEVLEILRELKPGTQKPKITEKDAGAFISYVPGKIVEPYGNGDVARTLKLFRMLFEEVTVTRGMREAYDRERKVMPIFLENERIGIRVDLPGLERDQKIFEDAQSKADAWLRKALKAPGLDFDKDAEVAKALDKAGAVSEWHRTKTGRLSVSKKNLKLDHFNDSKVAAAYSYRQRCATTLETFIRPWQHHGASGRMHTTWNQVRQTKGEGDTGGTRTGRPSSQDPNFLNMAKPFKEGGVSEYAYPKHIPGVVPLPAVRRYILPDEKKHKVGRRDYNQQELRLLAHFEDGVDGIEGALLQAYIADPRLDVHEFVRASIEQSIGLDVGRSVTKTLNFGYIYGQGIGSLAEKLNKTVEEVRAIRDAQMSAVPGMKRLSDSIKKRSNRGLPIRTWGGREYYVEPPRVIDDILRRFEYKLLNYLIQGSAADVTKESIIRYYDVRKEGRLLLTVYDENDISAPAAALKREMLILREAMMSIELDVPLISDGEIGPTLGDLVELKEPKPDLSRWGIR
jgi:DNA polymerase I-like protein with 3'-5' exonuclease and polymerase domains